MEDFIQLKKSNIIKIGIKDQDGNDTGKYLKFDLEDVELPLRYQECAEEHKKNINYLQHQLLIIDKREDVKGKKLLTRNEEDRYKAINEFYKREMKALDLFLGEGCTQMILDIMGRKPYFTMLDDIAESLKPIIPVLEKNVKITRDNIIAKYNIKSDNVLK